MATKYAMWVMAGALLCAGTAYGQDANLAAGGSESIWRGTLTNAAAGASLDQGALSSDGRRDLIIGAPGVSGDPGKVFVIFGGTIPTGDLSLTSADVVFHGATASDRFGAATAAGNIRTLENLSSDPPRDLVVGAPGGNGGAGVVYLFAAGNGFPEGAVRRAANVAGADGYTLRILGRPGDQLGAALATADVNNDGYRDIVIGAPGSSRVYVVSGGTVLPAGSTVDLNTTAPLAAITGVGIGRVLAAGDVTGDNRSEVLIGAPQEGAGQVYMLVNSAAGLAGPIGLPGTAVVFSGVAAGDQAGMSITVASSFDADNFRDIIIGAPMADPLGRTDAGSVYVIWGRSTGLTSRSLAAADATFIGESAGIHVGAYVTSGSVNRDNQDDLVMLAAGANAGHGELRLYYGGARASRSGAIDLVNGVARRFFAHPSEGPLRTAIVFEVTGEGARDVIVGVPTASGRGLAGNGLVYFSLSPRMRLSPASFSFKASHFAPRSATIRVLNPGVGDVTWTATSNAPWLTVSPANGVSTASAPGTLTLTVQPAAAAGTSVASVTIRSTSIHLTMSLTLPVTVVCCSASDFDGDSRADLAVYRPSNGSWYIRYSAAEYTNYGIHQWGLQSDVPLQADFDGDAKTDLTVYRPSTGEWYVLFSSGGYSSYAIYQWGIAGDRPMTSDFDGDGKADITVFRPSTGEWYVRPSSNGYSSYSKYQWGMNGDTPVSADFDGDGKADISVFRPSTGEWYVRSSSNGYSNYVIYQWGMSGDTPIAADFDGDGKADLGVFRPASGEWYLRFSSNGYSSYVIYQWGLNGDTPMAADFDGDGKADLSVFRPSTGDWYTRFSSFDYSMHSYSRTQWGMNGDIPLAPR